MNYTLVRRKGQKNIRMHFNDKGILMVSAPYYVSKQDVDEFVLSNTDWIEKQQRKQQNHSFSTGDTLCFFGVKYDLVVNQSTVNRLEIIGKLMIVYTKSTDTADVMKIIRKYYTQKLCDYVMKRADYWVKQLNLKMPQIKICNSKTRWGVCIKSRNLIKISLMTCTLDENLIDMIVLHEICHLVYLNHQKEFWDLMEEHMPDIECRKKALRAESREGYHKNLFN